MNKLYALLILSHIALVNAMDKQPLSNDELKKQFNGTGGNSTQSTGAQQASLTALAWSMAQQLQANVHPDNFEHIGKNISRLAEGAAQVYTAGMELYQSASVELNKQLASATDQMERFNIYKEALAKAYGEGKNELVTQLKEQVRNDTTLLDAAKELLLKPYLH